MPLRRAQVFIGASRTTLSAYESALAEHEALRRDSEKDSGTARRYSAMQWKRRAVRESFHRRYRDIVVPPLRSRRATRQPSVAEYAARFMNHLRRRVASMPRVEARLAHAHLIVAGMRNG